MTLAFRSALILSVSFVLSLSAFADWRDSPFAMSRTKTVQQMPQGNGMWGKQTGIIEGSGEDQSSNIPDRRLNVMQAPHFVMFNGLTWQRMPQLPDRQP